jgi:hypothetical protein
MTIRDANTTHPPPLSSRWKKKEIKRRKEEEEKEQNYFFGFHEGWKKKSVWNGAGALRGNDNGPPAQPRYPGVYNHTHTAHT